MAALDGAAPRLRNMPVCEIVAAIDRALACWREPGDPGRAALLEHGPALTGYSRETLAYAIDHMLPEFGEHGLRRLLTAELGDPAALDGFVTSENGPRHMARGPGRQVHVFAGTVPTVPVFSLICGLLLKSPVLAKPSSHDPLIPAVFAQLLARVEPRLAGALAVLPWSGGDEPLEREALAGAGAVIVYGSAETVATYRAMTPATTRFVGYGHALSVAAIAREALTAGAATETARRLAWDVALFDQRGCLSPQFALLERGGETAPEAFCELLGAELDGLRSRLPRGPLDAAGHARVRAVREAVRFRAAVEPGVRLWESAGSTDWTVLLLPRLDPGSGGEHRAIAVVPADDLAAALPAACAGLSISCIGLAATPQRTRTLEPVLSRLATRICPLGRMQEPPITWRHDGRPNLSDLTTWVEIEGG
ncbi:MAG TPA: acyl-CoA reductase [Dehalococcoidia bacterium]|nr:acyl-CoA reductase [Dehalococcoidia bacterium]